jgi:hypothetical protein
VRFGDLAFLRLGSCGEMIAPRDIGFENEQNQLSAKRQQRCWEGAGSGSDGVDLDSIGKMGILSLENALEATDSDLLQN